MKHAILTAVMRLELETGEMCAGPITVGIYSNCNEVFLQQKGNVVSIPANHLRDVIAEMRRAAKIRAERLARDGHD